MIERDTVRALAMIINREIQVSIENAPPKTWPFISVDTLVDRIQRSPRAARAAFLMVYCNQRDHEIESRTTTDSNRKGFSGSHALPSTGVARQVIERFQEKMSQDFLGNQDELFDEAWSEPIDPPTDRYGIQLPLLKADRRVWRPDQQGILEFAEYIGTRYPRNTLRDVRESLMWIFPELLEAARVISPSL